jgi:hypothetical protein
MLKFVHLSPLYPIILDDVVANLAATVVIWLRPRQGHRAPRNRHHDCSSGWQWAVWRRENCSHTRRIHWAKYTRVKERTSNDGLPIFSKRLFAIVHNFLALTIRYQNVFVYLFMSYLTTLSHSLRVQRRMTG